MLLNTQPIEVGFKKITDTVKEYPNAENLILSLVTIFSGRCMVLGLTDKEYEDWIHSTYKQFLEDDTYSFVKESAGWEDFKKKWSS